MGAKPYPAYKDSGIEWIGDIPEHWEVKRLKSLFSYAKGKNAAELSVTYVNTNVGKYPVYSGQTENKGVMGYINCFEYDFLEPVTLVSTVGARAMTTLLVQGRFSLSQNCALIIPRGINADSKFYDACFLKLFAYERASISLIMQPSLRFIDLDRFLVPSPPLEEQKLIASFLDRETGKIDTLVEHQQQLITLLKEQRQSLISHIVTKGLNPNVRMKDSGVEWLGEIPEHWDVKRLKDVTKGMKAGPFGSALTKDVYVSEGYRVYGQEQVIPNNFTIGDYFITPKKYDELSQYRVSPGDILISCVGTFGKIAIVPNFIAPGIINPRLIRLRCGKSVKPEYLVEVMRSTVTFEQLSSTSRGGTMDIINIGTLSGIFLALPPQLEQLEIIDFLDQETSKIDELVIKANQSIALLKERRSSLISAAVTGKIDVREAA